MIKSLLVLIIAVILCLILLPVGFLFTLVGLLCFQNKKPYRLGIYFLLVSVALDQLGNVVCAYVFNDTLIKKGMGADFGNPDETISSVIGKNKKAGNLRTAGKILDWILSKFERDHSVKWIENPKPAKEF